MENSELPSNKGAEEERSGLVQFGMEGQVDPGRCWVLVVVMKVAEPIGPAENLIARLHLTAVCSERCVL